MAATPDRIEKQIVVPAALDRVWRALGDAAEFGAWFGVKLDGSFAPGARVTGRVVNPPGLEHLKVEIEIAQVVPRKSLSFRWHPYAIDPKADYSKEPTTLVEFRLEEAPGKRGATRVTVVESGFEGLPAARRTEAYQANDGGWTIQCENLARHVTTR
jgi:uncharacterized protein YndB with AHSA1/START domain